MPRTFSNLDRYKMTPEDRAKIERLSQSAPPVRGAPRPKATQTEIPTEAYVYVGHSGDTTRGPDKTKRKSKKRPAAAPPTVGR